VGKYYAHSIDGADKSKWQPLEAHLKQVAELARGFAAEFGSGEWGYLAGLWHDLGKYSPDFQRYIDTGSDAHLETMPGKVNHSSAGALFSLERFDKLGRILAYPIAGHHAGLPDWQCEIHPRASLSHRLADGALLKAAQPKNIPSAIADKSLPAERPKPGTDLNRSMWVRMLFSCLVDSDFLDTEAFMNPATAGQREGYPMLASMAPFFDQYMADKLTSAPDTAVNRLRAEVLAGCKEKAEEPPGFFTLSVPTGGGKTFSSLAFAFRHAITHKKRRIIYVIPYTSIIEQTADQFRNIFGDSVLEHHSNLDADEIKENSRSRLACENWDAPLIVTTTVQFFESLFANRSSRCRKLHNIAGSVVVLDEAQLIPPDFLNPILEAIKELQLNYGVTFVFSTATQPALGPRKSMDFNFPGLPAQREIISDPSKLHKQLRRTKIETIENLEAPLPWDDLADRLAKHKSALCIVNRRDDARTLWEKMPEGTFHLSALMCGAHRSKRIEQIRSSLSAKKPTLVISTQLVEAGVDLDFPVVYRALAGLDSVAQAAGRCNREGLLDCGKVFVFLPESKIPAGHLRQAAEIGRQLLSTNEDDPLAPEQFEVFFQRFYWQRGERLDKERILELLTNDRELRISFRSAAEKFQIIDEDSYSPALVRWGEGSNIIDQLRRLGPERWLLRKAQRFVVNLPRHMHGKLRDEGALEEIHPGVFVQAHGNLYDEELGFCADRSIVYEPDELMF